MKTLIALALAVVFSAPTLADTQNTEAKPALAWLQLVDAGEYSKSWQQAAPFFQSKVSSSQWQAAIEKARKPLGKIISRRVVKTTSHTSLPGAPKGEYTVVITTADFEHKQSSTETTTLQKTENDQWKVVGYYVK